METKASPSVFMFVLWCVDETSCASLASSLKSNPSHLRELDLNLNKVQDIGVSLLCVGMESPHCRLEALRLKGCQITDEGCASLASALKSNPSHLKELDLSLNKVQNTGANLLSAGLESPQWRLKTEVSRAWTIIFWPQNIGISLNSLQQKCPQMLVSQVVFLLFNILNSLKTLTFSLKC
uniref:SPRY-associated domain-containing protein n=1 Tax=Monopterus albus TaxID=43700 RepID=A0A3Q3QTH0_MONAL